jgi:hypothetical protein
LSCVFPATPRKGSSRLGAAGFQPQWLDLIFRLADFERTHPLELASLFVLIRRRQFPSSADFGQVLGG